MHTLLKRGLALAGAVGVALATAIIGGSAPAHAAQTAAVRTEAATGDLYGYTFNVNSGYVLAILNASTANGGVAIQAQVSTALPNNDYMYFEWQGGSNWYRIKPLHTFSDDGNLRNDKCLAVVNASKANYAFVGNYTCTYDSTNNDVWLRESVFYDNVYYGDQFRNLNSKKCLVVQNASPNPNARIQQYDCEAGVGAPFNELWLIR